MPYPANNLLLLDEAQAEFLQHHTSISVAARNSALLPAVARAYGIQVGADRRHVSVFLCAVHASEVLACLRQNGEIAVAVSRPQTHQTLQLKGTVTSMQPVSNVERELMLAYRDSFSAELAPMGYPQEFVQGLFAGGDDCWAVTFALTALFDQSPGPQAGRRLA